MWETFEISYVAEYTVKALGPFSLLYPFSMFSLPNIPRLFFSSKPLPARKPKVSCYNLPLAPPRGQSVPIDREKEINPFCLTQVILSGRTPASPGGEQRPEQLSLSPAEKDPRQGQ